MCCCRSCDEGQSAHCDNNNEKPILLHRSTASFAASVLLVYSVCQSRCNGHGSTKTSIHNEEKRSDTHTKNVYPKFFRCKIPPKSPPPSSPPPRAAAVEEMHLICHKIHYGRIHRSHLGRCSHGTHCQVCGRLFRPPWRAPPLFHGIQRLVVTHTHAQTHTQKVCVREKERVGDVVLPWCVRIQPLPTTLLQLHPSSVHILI